MTAALTLALLASPTQHRFERGHTTTNQAHQPPAEGTPGVSQAPTGGKVGPNRGNLVLNEAAAPVQEGR